MLEKSINHSLLTMIPYESRRGHTNIISTVVLCRGAGRCTSPPPRADGTVVRVPEVQTDNHGGDGFCLLLPVSTWGQSIGASCVKILGIGQRSPDVRGVFNRARIESDRSRTVHLGRRCTPAYFAVGDGLAGAPSTVNKVLTESSRAAWRVVTMLHHGRRSQFVLNTVQYY